MDVISPIRFLHFFWRLSILFDSQNFSTDNNLRSKLVENNQKVNNTKEIFLFVYIPQ